MRVDKPGIYEMSLAEYVADPAPQPSVNTSTALTLLTQSPMHAKMQHVRLNPNAEREESSRADLGTIAHALLLEDDDSRVVEIDADDWRTKAAKEKRDEARAAGKVPVLKRDYGKVKFMVETAQKFLMGSGLCADWFGAKSEQTLVWQEEGGVYGVWCRSRPDKLTEDYHIYWDYKTSASANPIAFTKTMISQGYDLQVALGTLGVKALTGINCTVIFLVQEIEPPYACSLVSPSPMFLTIADERLAIAIDRWKKCVAEDYWPGYPDKVATVDPPAWYGMEQLEAL